jgi:hypothetical protein
VQADGQVLLRQAVHPRDGDRTGRRGRAGGQQARARTRKPHTHPFPARHVLPFSFFLLVSVSIYCSGRQRSFANTGLGQTQRKVVRLNQMTQQANSIIPGRFRVCFVFSQAKTRHDLWMDPFVTAVDRLSEMIEVQNRISISLASFCRLKSDNFTKTVSGQTQAKQHSQKRDDDAFSDIEP